MQKALLTVLLLAAASLASLPEAAAQLKPPPPRRRPPPPRRPPPRRPPPRSPPPPKRPPPRPRPPPPSPPPNAVCLANSPSCTRCDPTGPGGEWQCAACDRFSTLDTTTGWLDRNQGIVDEPFCVGVCNYYRESGNVLEDDTNPCLACTGGGGCTTCKAGAFMSPSTYMQKQYNLPSLPAACASCGFCQVRNCTSNQGCTACEDGAMAMSVAPWMQSTDPKVCITEFCETFIEGLPTNHNLFSYSPQCKPASGATPAACSPAAGCTACQSGFYLAQHPLIPAAAICQQCEGCSSSNCGEQGCTTCNIPGLGTRVALPAATKTKSGKTVFACRNSSTTIRPFLGKDSILLGRQTNPAVWPVTEFANCPDGYGDYMFQWYGASDITTSTPNNQQFAISSWFNEEQQTFDFSSTGRTTLTFTFNATRTGVRLEFTNATSKQSVVRTFFHALPRTQDRVCLSVSNYVMSETASNSMLLAINIINNAASSRKILVRLSGERHLTPRPDDPTFIGGRTIIYGRSTSTVLADPSKQTVRWTNTENVIVLTESAEWDELKSA